MANHCYHSDNMNHYHVQKLNMINLIYQRISSLQFKSAIHFKPNRFFYILAAVLVGISEQWFQITFLHFNHTCFKPMTLKTGRNWKILSWDQIILSTYDEKTQTLKDVVKFFDWNSQNSWRFIVKSRIVENRTVSCLPEFKPLTAIFLLSSWELELETNSGSLSGILPTGKYFRRDHRQVCIAHTIKIKLYSHLLVLLLLNFQ